MIVKAAVKILDLRENKEKTLPCMRHSDIFYILKELNYKLNIDYKIIAQGFLDETDTFYNRIEAKKHAQKCQQIIDTEYSELFSEDLW